MTIGCTEVEEVNFYPTAHEVIFDENQLVPKPLKRTPTPDKYYQIEENREIKEIEKNEEIGELEEIVEVEDID